MDYFCKYTDLISEGNLGKETDENILLPHIQLAHIEIVKLITQDVYDEHFEAGEDDENYIILKKAEANLALSYAVYALNIETQGNGLVRATGFNESRKELLGQSEIEKLSTHFRDIAMDLLNPYIATETSTEETPADQINLGALTLSAI